MKAIIPLLAALLLMGCSTTTTTSGPGPGSSFRPPISGDTTIVRAQPSAQVEVPQRDRQRRAAYLAAHPELPADVRLWISEGKVATDMSPAEVIATWGEPDRKQTSQGTTGPREEWVFEKTHVFFENGKVTSWSVKE